MSAVSADGTCPVCGLTAGTYQPAPHHIPPGTILMNRYLFGRVLGEGGFGITYLACDLRLDLKVAIKEYFPTDKATRHAATSLDVTSYTSSAADSYEHNKRKFLSEARTMAKMEKQAEVVGVRDFFEVNNTAYIVMEFVDGTTFRDLVKQEGGKIATKKLLETIEPLFSALSAMHEAGLVHRDISPDNLMLEHGKVRLLDFGCARESTTGTNTLTIALKHGYAPIEQYTNHGQGPWTDIYSLAATIYFCLTGKSPVRSTDRLLGDELILPSKLGIDLSPEQEKALLRAMAIQPRRRYQTMQEFRAAIYEASPNIPEPPTPPVPEIPPIEIPPAPVTHHTSAVKMHTEAVDPPVQKEKTVTESLKPAPKPRGSLITILGVLLAIAIVVSIVVITGYLKDKPKGPQPLPGTDSQYTVETAPVNDTASPLTLEAVPGENAENYQRFLDALADPEVSEIHITGDGSLEACEFVQTVISKPVYLDTEMICYFPVEIVGGGHLVVNGRFNSEGYLRTRDGGKVTIADDADVHLMGMVWLENSGDMIDWDGSLLTRWVFSEAEAAANAVHVTSWEELKQAMDTTSENIIIDADITVTDDAWDVFDRTVIISSGVTVTSQTNDFDIYGNLLNYGTLILKDGYGYTAVFQNGRLVNYGTLEINNGDSLHPDDHAVVLNLGSIKLPDAQSSVHTNGNSTFLNMGTLETAYIGNNNVLINSGSIRVTGNDYLSNHSTLVNWGNLMVDHRIDNYGYILNGGNLTAESIYNVGYLDECNLEISPEGRVDIRNIDSSRGIYATKNQDILSTADGIIDLNSNIPLGDRNNIMDWLQDEEAITVSTEAELFEALDSEYPWIVVAEDITCTRDLNLDQNLMVPQGRTLRFAEGTSLYAWGVTVSVTGSLTGDYLHFEDGARLIHVDWDDSILEAKTLVLQDESLCLLRHAALNAEKFIVQENSVVVCQGGTIDCTKQLLLDSGSNLMLLDGIHGVASPTLVDESHGVVSLSTPEFLIRTGCRFTNMSPLRLCDMQLTIEGDVDNLNTLILIETNLTVKQNAWLYCNWDATLSIQALSTLENNGIINIDGNARMHADVVNNGEMYASSLTISGSFRNNGKIFLWKYGDGLVDLNNVFTGNPPKYFD